MLDSKSKVIEYINALKGYEGYVQFSYRPIDKDKDVFVGTDPKIEDEAGFIYEAHFFNGTDAISIRQQNNTWVVSTSKNVPLDTVETYSTKVGLQVKMAQVWEAKADPLCEGMEVQMLQKVVFAGFTKGEKS
ncbi:TIGR04423 family type III CRISPR-associated protein [Sulfurovum sp.]|uniref:TIGR04423 family type III CRISPR-associated protein n=1 Tax=Sulfurovum sp. TaxID=1969726 RepID=UPI0025ED2B77|nr:TIGR04423 family type III CRISPR-associated protein [Sulfurovum sp.]